MSVTGFVASVRSEWLASLSGRALSLGLFDGEDELEDPGYARQPVEFGDPQSTEDGLQFIENVNDAVFKDMARAHSVDRWGVFDEQGQLLGGGRLEEPVAIAERDRMYFDPGFFTLGLP